MSDDMNVSVKPDFGAGILVRLDALATVSETRDGLTRRYLTSQHRQANDLVGEWMRAAGMTVRQDAIGNIIGRYEGAESGAQALIIGSHLDTVVMAGKYDGMLGVVTAIACVSRLNERGLRLPFAVEVVGFADEEGIRFQSTYLGSRAIAGTFNQDLLDARDADGITMAEALRSFGLDPDRIRDAARKPDDVLAYLEIHIEQGPVLESAGQALGVVTAIAGATRRTVTITGVAGHAGTVPMGHRNDALLAAAECALAVETVATKREHVVGTVGRMTVGPGAANVVPGVATFTVDLRADADKKRKVALAELDMRFDGIAKRRGVAIDVRTVHEAPSVACAPWLVRQIEAAVEAEVGEVVRLPSGAGHDAAAMADLCDVGMIFVRCGGGVSHNPDETITASDAAAGAALLLRVIENFQAKAKRGR
ncbi:MAG: allantoate amidohydrolase [Rhodospirillaceae bacterium]